MDKKAFLRTTPLFEGVGDGVVAEISQHVFEKQLKRGEAVTSDGSKGMALYFVAEGVVKVYKTSSEGKEQILNIVRPGDYFNEMVLDNKSTMANAEAMGPVLLYGIRKTRLRTILSRYPKIASNMYNMLTGRIRHFVSLVEDLSFRTVTARVAKVLVENSQAAGGVRLTQRDIASIVGTAREVVNRSLRYLDDHDLLEMRRQHIVLKNIEGLKEFAEIGA